MKKIISIVITLWIFGNAHAQSDSSKIAVAQNFLNNLNSGMYSMCLKDFDWDLAGKVNSAALENIWKNLQTQSGVYKGAGEPYLVKDSLYDYVYQTCAFAKTKLDLKITVNQKNKIAGLFFVPPVSRKGYQLPSFVKKDEVIETPLEIKSGAYTLPAILIYPKSGSNFPVVILVHGSGPNDKDETIGPNKIFKDLAFGLANKGIAVLRYEKRTRQYANILAEKKDSITLNDEVIEDALAAIATAKAIVAVDPKRVFVCGHSLGGMCAPLIASKAKDLAGIIIMAGNARPLEDLVLEQVKYLASLSPETPESKSQIEDLKVQVLNVKTISKESDLDTYQLPLGISKTYWLSLKDYNQVAVAKPLTCKILVLQGGRDYQVTKTDYEIWKKELKGTNVQFKLYENLNHLFMEGTDKSTPDEYNKEGNIPEYVVKDIADFCK
jgi:hypothetical protein